MVEPKASFEQKLLNRMKSSVKITSEQAAKATPSPEPRVKQPKPPLHQPTPKPKPLDQTSKNSKLGQPKPLR